MTADEELMATMREGLLCVETHEPLDAGQFAGVAVEDVRLAAARIAALLEERNANERIISQLREALKAQHEWHLNAGAIGIPDGAGGWIEIDNGAEYTDAKLCEITTAALDASANPLLLPEEGWEPMPRGGMRQHWWSLSILERRKRMAAEAREKVLREALEWYAEPEIYKAHPHGPAFDRRDLTATARAALASTGGVDG